MLRTLWLALTSSFVWAVGTYVDQKHSFELRVPVGYVFLGSDIIYCNEYNPEASVCFKYPPKRFPGTNFKGAFIDIRVVSAATEKACIEAADPDYRPDPNGPTKVIDGIEFRHALRGGAAAGTETSFDRYGGFEQGKCFELTVAVSQSASANYEPGSIKEFTKHDEQGSQPSCTTLLLLFMPSHNTELFEICPKIT